MDKDERRIVFWGDGSDTREVLYVVDCAEAIVLATEKYDGREPVNVGAGFEVRIRDLTNTIAELTGFEGEDRLGYGESQWPAEAMFGHEPGGRMFRLPRQ